ncbi:MAG: hypothetical protein LBS20_00195 [Prevotella sp.]|jgi:hypothetical protein|nr:hypothetical protein [Prevotella sp.]
MKKLLFLIFPIMVAFAACGTDDGVSPIKRWTGTNDITDFQAYVGATGGAKPITYALDTMGRTDSARNAFYTRKMNSVYNANLFKEMSIYFNEDKVTYVDSVGLYKIVSTYHFKNDSLFVLKNGNKNLFIAMGNMDTLYRTKGYARYISPKTGNDTTSYHDFPLTPDIVAKLAGFPGAAAMESDNDTIVWLNAKYIFK